MSETPNKNLRVLWPGHAVPGAIAVIGDDKQAQHLRMLEEKSEDLVYIVRAVISDHIPLASTLEQAITATPTSSITLKDAPPAMYLHHGGRNAVYFVLASQDAQNLDAFEVEVQTDVPLSAFQVARTEVNQLLDTLMRRAWLPLTISRLELLDSDRQILGYQLMLPFSAEVVIGPVGGIHQYPVFSELEAVAREAICSTSPYYRLLCAYRLYDGTSKLRKWMRKVSKELSVDVPLPKDLVVDVDLLTTLGFNSEFCGGIRTVGDLFGKLTDTRNKVAHFLLTKGGEQPPLHLSNGGTYLEYSAASTALLHYSVQTLGGLASHFRQYLGGALACGSVLPTLDQKSKYRIATKREASS